MDKCEVLPLTPARWNDLETLFGPNGAYSGCWCMWPYQTGAEFARNHGSRNREAFQQLVERTPPGLLAYAGDEPVGWVAVGPRHGYGRVIRSPLVRRTEGDQVWSIVCFYIRRSQRSKGMGQVLVEAAVDHSRSCGAATVEAYPLDRTRVRSSDAWPGVVSMFRNAGFTEVARASPARPVMRLTL